MVKNNEFLVNGEFIDLPDDFNMQPVQGAPVSLIYQDEAYIPLFGTQYELCCHPELMTGGSFWSSLVAQGGKKIAQKLAREIASEYGDELANYATKNLPEKYRPIAQKGIEFGIKKLAGSGNKKRKCPDIYTNNNKRRMTGGRYDSRSPAFQEAPHAGLDPHADDQFLPPYPGVQLEYGDDGESIYDSEVGYPQQQDGGGADYSFKRQTMGGSFDMPSTTPKLRPRPIGGGDPYLPGEISGRDLFTPTESRRYGGTGGSGMSGGLIGAIGTAVVGSLAKEGMSRLFSSDDKKKVQKKPKTPMQMEQQRVLIREMTKTLPPAQTSVLTKLLGKELVDYIMLPGFNPKRQIVHEMFTK